MNLQDFINAYNGQSVGGGQCVALVKQYQIDVLNTTAPAVGNAKDYWENYESTQFLQQTYDKIPLSSGGAIGDVVVWNGNVGGGYGHIAIVTGNISGNGFTSFDQNWNTPLRCNIENHNYNNVYGFLRPKNSPTPDNPNPPTPDEPSEPITKKKSKFPFVLLKKKINQRRYY